MLHDFRMSVICPVAVRKAALRLQVLLLTTAALAFGGSEAARATEPARTFGDSIGLVVKFAQGQPMSELNMLTDLKVKWVRDVIAWPEVEPAPGAFVDFNAGLKRRLAFYRNNDIGVIALLTLANEKAYPATTSQPLRAFDADNFGRYAATVAKLLRESGVRFVIELGNEPHNSALVKLVGGQWNGSGPSPWVDHYVHMVDEAVRRTKAIDPSIKLMTDDDMWVVHYWFLQAGLPKAIDGFAVHPYSNVPETTAVQFDTDWTKPYTVVDESGSIGSAVRRLKEQGTLKLKRTPEVWFTEVGWPIGIGPPGAKHVPEDLLVDYLPRTFILGAASGARVICWFSSRDVGDGPMGLIDNEGHARKPYQSFRTMSQQLGAYRFVRQVAGASSPGKGLQAFLFQGAKDSKIALWTADDKPVRVALPSTSAVDAMGRDVPLASGAKSIAVTGTPLYLSGNWSNELIEHLAKNVAAQP